MEKEAMISIENLNKQFKNQLVLNNINVKFSNGHICKLCLNGMPVPLLRNGYSIFNGTKYR